MTAVTMRRPTTRVVTFPHSSIHSVAQHACTLCPPVPCVCGAPVCPQAFEHRRSFAGAESSWREAA